MDHVNSYFLNVNKKLIEKKLEKEVIINVVKKITSVDLLDKDFVIKNNLVKLKLFGPKRHKVVSFQDQIIEDLSKQGITILRVE